MYAGSDIVALSTCFNSILRGSLNAVAPLKTKPFRSRHEPWLNDTTSAARRECRRAECKWKKDKLQVSFQILKGSWCFYQRSVKAAKTKFYSDIINYNLNAPQSTCLENCAKVSGNFVTFCFEKVVKTRALICPASHDPSIS